MNFEFKHINNSWSYYHIPELEKQNIIHGFFTKTSPSRILKGDGRKSFLDTFSLKDLIIMHQEHGEKIHTIRNGEKPISGDGVILLEKNVAGIIKTADCLPIVICEPDYPMAAIIHAGWRGTLKRITKKAIHEMVKLGGERKRMVALLGPAIGPCCYEIKEDVHSVLRSNGFPEHIFRKTETSLFLNLKRANTGMLKDGGIEKIYDTGFCTCCNENLFYSYRRGQKEDRQINFVSLKG